jgi:TRAP-type mannitol/chloroaromatic compound transport system permease small subunit
VENDSHIRIDIFHDRFKPRTKAWIDFIGIIFFLIPYALVILIYSVPLIEYSIETGERSTSPGGLPYPLITIWKSFMFIGYALLIVAAVSRLIRASSLLFGHSDLNSTAR